MKDPAKDNVKVANPSSGGPMSGFIPQDEDIGHTPLADQALERPNRPIDEAHQERERGGEKAGGARAFPLRLCLGGALLQVLQPPVRRVAHRSAQTDGLALSGGGRPSVEQ